MIPRARRIPWPLLALATWPLAGCYTNARHGRLGDLRGATRGVTLSPARWGDVEAGKPLSPDGRRVALVDAAPADCAFAGWISGVAGPVADSTIAESRGDLEARVPGADAVVSARNTAAEAGLAAISIDAYSLVEEHHRHRRGRCQYAYGPGLFVVVYARAWRCPR